MILLLLALQVDTFAGTGQAGRAGDGGPATAAQINNPFGVVRGPDGAIYFCEYDGQVVRRVGKDGTISTVAGTGDKGYAGGPALQAKFSQPHEIRFDARGDLYVADMQNHAIRKIDMKSGVVTTVAGTGKPGYAGDGGPATEALLKQPHSLQFGPGGDLYVCDIGNHVIRRVDPSGKISTFAGTGKAGPTPDGAPIQGTPLNGPRSLDFDAQGRLWLATREGNQVFRFESGKIHHVAGTGKKGFTGNGGPARDATLSGPKGIAVAPNGDVLLVDTESHSIRRIVAKTGRLELVIGTGEKGDGPDGPPGACRLARPHGIWADPDGTLFVGDSENHRVRRLK
ncbi:MAG TPA: hypothetical protein VF950_05645 [Planctomycetota bacterium]